MAYLATITNAGLAIITNRLMGSGTAPKYIGWGTGTTEAAVSQTDLVTPSAEARVSGTESQASDGGITNDTYQVVGSITSASSQAITEVALFDNSTSGNMFARANFAAINVVLGDIVEFTIKATASQT